MGEHGAARAGGRRLPAPGGARRPLPDRQAGAARVDRQLLDQGDREAVRVRAHRRGRGRRRGGRAVRGVARERGGRDPRRGRASTTRRTAAPPSSCTSGCSRSGRRDVPWRLPPDQRERTEEAEERDEEREALRSRACSTGRRRATRVGCSRTSSTTTSASSGRSGGSGSAGRSSTTTSSSATGRRSAGSSWDGAAPTVEAQSHAYRMTFPPQEHKIDREGWSPDPRTSRASARASAPGSTTTTGSSPSCAARSGSTSRSRAALTPGPPIEDWVKRDALLRFVRAYADGDRPAIRQPSRCSSGGRPTCGSTWATRSTRCSRSARATCSCRARPGRGRPGRARGWRSR